MNAVISLLLGLTLLLAPLLSAIPDEPVWSSWLSAGTFLAALLAVAAARKNTHAGWLRPSRAEQAFLVLLGLAFLSIPVCMVVQHGTGFFGPMLRGWALLAANFLLFALARRVAGNRVWLYALVFAAVAGSAIAADVGVQEYAVHLRAGQSSWRIFGTSTPDYLAGYFVLLLPVTLALFLQAPSVTSLTPLLRSSVAVALGVILLFQLVALLTTGSRFGLVSLAVSLGIFGVSLAWAIRRGLRLSLASWALLGVLGVSVLLAGAVAAKPVLNRLHNVHDNSAAFRVWTWKGSVKMAAANPVIGTGVGTWPDLYPRYALTGFTRVAHNSYLQLADECGIPALLVLLGTLGLLGVSLTRGLSAAPVVEAPAPPTPPVPQGRKGRRQATPVAVKPPKADYLPSDNRLLLCGLLAALAGGIVQNLIDSDWYVFFLGTTFWTLAGLAAGIAAPISVTEEKPAQKPILIALGSVSAVFCVLTATEGIAASYAAQAQTNTGVDPAGAAQTYDMARAWDPLNGRYPSDQGYKVFYVRGGDLHQAETSLRTAVALVPNSVNYRRLGTILQAGGRQSEAMQAYQAGLEAEPNSLDILNDLARLTPLPGRLDYYRRLSELELSPVGTVRALGEMTETKFARADVVMGEEAARADPAKAIAYYARAASVLEKYADEGGSLNEQRLASDLGHANQNLDADMGGLYKQALDDWIPLIPPDQQPALRQRQKEYQAKFADLFARSSKSGTM